MPPRKRARASAASTPLPDPQPKPPPSVAAAEPDEKAQEKANTAKDPWTDEEETQLLKAIIKWKPTGIHKHLRMISIANDLRSHGYAYGPNSSEHMRIPGLWKKLESLYDLDALDTREDEYHGWTEVTGKGEEEDGEDQEEDFVWPPDVRPFSLPEDVFGERMWLRRLKHPPKQEEAGEDVEMRDADADAAAASSSSSRDSSPEVIEGLNSTWSCERERELPAHVQALIDEAAAAAPAEEDATTATRTGKGGKKKATVTRSASTRTRPRATRSTPAQETEDDEEEDEEEDDDEEEESTAAGSPPASTKAPAKATRKQPATRKSTRKR